MKERIFSETQPDFEASRWLRFGGIKPVPDDPETAAHFTAAYICLTTIANYLTYVAGPWFTVTPEEIADAHRGFIARSERYNEISQETGEGFLTTDISLHYLLALSTCRLYALEKFGGEGSEEYYIFCYFHNMIAPGVRQAQSLSPYQMTVSNAAKPISHFPPICIK